MVSALIKLTTAHSWKHGLKGEQTDMKRLGCILGVIVWICWILWGCGSGKEEDTDLGQEQGSEKVAVASPVSKTPSLPENAVAVVNGQVITNQELAERLHVAVNQLELSSPPDDYTLNRLREDALAELVKKALIAQEAQKQNVTVTDEEFQQRVKQVQDEYNGKDIQSILKEQGKSYAEWEKAQHADVLLDKLLDVKFGATITIADEEVRQYYDRNQAKYDYPAQVRASQILTYEEDVAQKALQEIRSGVDFAEVAKKCSESQDAANGGDLGFFAKGVMPPEFDEVIFALKMGEVSEVVKTSYGYQIFKLTGQREAHKVSFEDAQEQIKTLLKKQKRMAAFDLWFADIQKNSNITLNQELIKQVE